MSESPYSLLVSRLDFHRVDRRSWQNAVSGPERERLQQVLLQLATEHFQGTELDLVGLLKAAHAVLPLRGEQLKRLASLLVKYPAEIEDWLDVLVECLADPGVRQSELPGRVLEALERHLTGRCDGKASPRMLAACRQLYGLGYRPAWIVKLVVNP